MIGGIMKHRIIIVGGGSAGISVAARLRRAGETDVAVIEPSSDHYYQPLWTLVGGGVVDVASTRRSEASVMPKGVTWIRKAAAAFHPEENAVETDDGARYEYDALVVCPGIQLDWAAMTGLVDVLGHDGVASNYRPDLAPLMWENVRGMRSGSAVFTMPTGAIKCAGAPQKIAYLAADHWRKQGVLGKIDIHLVVPGARAFGIPEVADQLDKVIADYGIHLHTESEVTAIDPSSRKVTVTGLGAANGTTTIDYDIAHVVPRQSAPDWVKASPLAADTPAGYVEVDKETMQHVRHPNVFALGDAGSTPNSKTGAAIRKQAPVVVANLLAHLGGRPLPEQYHGYGSCPITTSAHSMMLIEFDYTMKLTPSIPLIDQVKPRRDMWYLKRFGLPFLYWNLMLKGRA
jgi:sulfide:quinone oxidoreductase